MVVILCALCVGNWHFLGNTNASPGKLHFQQYNHHIRAGTIQTVYVYPLIIKLYQDYTYVLCKNYSKYWLYKYFLCPRHKMARGHLVFALSVIPPFRPSVASKFVFSTPPSSLHGFEWNLVQMLYHKSRSACGEIIHVGQILEELWSLTLRIFTHFSLSSQLLLHPCMDLNETWQGCYTTSLEVHVGR